VSAIASDSFHGTNDNDAPIEVSEQTIDSWADLHNTNTITSEATADGDQPTEHFSHAGEGSVSIEYYNIDGGSHSPLDHIDFNGSNSRQLIWALASLQQLGSE
jgi:hypothetical protein